MDALLTRFKQPGDEVFSTRAKLHIAGRIEDMQAEIDRLTIECQQTAWLHKRVEQLESELFEQRKLV